MNNHVYNEEQARKDILKALYDGSGHYLELVNLFNIGNLQNIEDKDFADVINKLVRSEHVEIKKQHGEIIPLIGEGNLRKTGSGRFFVYLTARGISKHENDSLSLWQKFVDEVKRTFAKKAAITFYAGIGVLITLLFQWILSLIE